MQAVTLRSFGGPGELRLEEINDPVPDGVVEGAAPDVRGLATGDRVMAIATPELDIDSLIDANITFHGILIGDDGQRTANLARLLASGELRPAISHVLPLAEAARRTGFKKEVTQAARSC